MKKIILSILFVCALGATSFKLAIEKGAATVEQKDGYYIFLLSKPTAKYEVIGTVKKGMAMTGQPDEMLNGIIKKVKKEYPKADAIIFTTIEMDKAEAVMFKE